MSALPDRQARTCATTVFDRNVVVLAGAGTGKTSLLVERVLNLIGTGFCDLERLAAITFTEKAAAELRFRIAEGLEQLRAAASGEGEPDEGDPSGRSHRWLTRDIKVKPEFIAERALAALQQMDRARLLTIHAFCAELLRAFPVEAGVDPAFRVDTGEQAEVFCREHWERFIEAELGAEGRRHELWNGALEFFSIKELAEAGRALSGWGFDTALLDRDHIGDGAFLTEEARETIEAIDALNERATGITPGQETWLGVVRQCLVALSDGDEDTLDTLLKDPKVQRELVRSKWTPGARLAGVSHEVFDLVFDRARQLTRMFPALDDARFGLLVELLAPFVTSFREEFSRRGFVSFDGLLALARDLLRDHPEVRQRLKRRFDTLLVDEFQDTDPLQYEIVLLLGEKLETSCKDPWQAELAQGRLFIVGDPKQSIYRFRGADYHAFGRAVETIGGGDSLVMTLHANFRSVAGILDPVNRLFAEKTSTCWKPDDTQPVYEPITAALDDPEPVEGAVEIWTVEGGRGDLIDRRRRTEGQLIAEKVEALHATGVPYGKISILFRTFASIPVYLRPLRERDIPFVVDGGKDFIKRPEIKQSLAVLRTLAQPSDSTALLAFLRSPAGGVSDTELATWAAAGQAWDWRRDPRPTAAELCPRIAECFAMLRALNDDTRHLPPDAAVRTIVERAHLLPLAAAAFEGAQRVANLHKLVAAASHLTRDGHLSLEDLVDEIEEGGLADLEADSPLSDDDTDAVRITSIHKMKGLENDWVLLPDLARQRVNPRAMGLRFAVVRDENGIARLAAQQGKYAVNRAFIRHHLDYLRHEESEETRVLYVALTRARNRLVLISSPGKAATRWYDALAGWGYDPALLPNDNAMLAAGAVRHRSVQPPGAVSIKDRKPPVRQREAVAVYDEARAALHREARPPFRKPSSVGHEDEAPRPIERGAGREIGLALGRVLHRALEFWDGVKPEDLADTAAWLANEEAAALGVDLDELQREVTGILETFHRSGLASAFAGLNVIARELPLLLRDDAGDCWRGSIDLVHRENDVFVIADYKTDRTADEATLSERYGGQLAIYARAVQAALDLPELPRMELWLLRHGRRIVVSPPESPAPSQPAKRSARSSRTKPEQQNLF